MTGSVGDNELAVRGGEVSVGDVNGDALLPLGTETVSKQRKIERACRAIPGCLGRGLDLILEHVPRIVEQAADKRALTVVNAAASKKAEQVFSVLLGKELFERRERVSGSGH